MPDLNVDIPSIASEETAETIRRAVANISELTAGSRQLAKEVVVSEDTEGPLAKGEGVLRIGVLYNGSIAQYASSHGNQVYDAMEKAGISRPENDPDVGVQIRLNQGHALIENTIQAA